MTGLGVEAIYVKIHHGLTPNPRAYSDLSAGWARAWKERGVSILGWGWVEGDPVAQAEIAVGLCQEFDLDGYIADAEDPYEFDGFWRSLPFVRHFRELAPHAPLGLSYIGDGYPYRMLDFDPWVAAGAALLPQCYWGDSATSIDPSLWAVDRLGAPRDIVYPTLGTSSFGTTYPPEFYRAELDRLGHDGHSIWLLESTPDDTLRALQP